VYQPVVSAGKPGSTESSDEIVALVRRLVSFSAWRFGQVQAKSLVSFAHGPGADEKSAVKQFFACYRQRQRRLDARGVSAVQDPAYPHAVTLWFTGSDSAQAMLVLLRDAELGAFSAEEMRLLGLARSLAEEALSAVTMPAETDAEQVLRRARPVLYILDKNYRTVMGNGALDGEGAGKDDLTSPGGPSGKRLPDVFETTIREMTTEWAADPTRPVDVATMPLPFLLMRIHDLSSQEGHFLAVTIEKTRRRNVLLSASKRFLITPREREVVASLLNGMRTDEIAGTLGITVSTVNDHIKKLIERTGASNRSQMLALILGWQCGQTGRSGR
jgi:DNA-binding CsgD family transcriptional regulator